MPTQSSDSDIADPTLAVDMLADDGWTDIVVTEWGRGWRVRANHPSGRPVAMSGATDESDATMDTPQEVAAHFIADRQAQIVPRETRIAGGLMVSGDAAKTPAAVGAGAVAAAVAPVAYVLPEESDKDTYEHRGGVGGGGDHVSEVHESDSTIPAYPGIAILPDEIGALRNAVRGMISEAKLVRMDVLADPSQRSFLAELWTDYNNLAAMHAPIDEHTERGYRAYMALEERDRAIEAHAVALERTARDADKSTLLAMAKNIWGSG